MSPVRTPVLSTGYLCPPRSREIAAPSTIHTLPSPPRHPRRFSAAAEYSDSSPAPDQRTMTRCLVCEETPDRKSTRLNSSHRCISYAVFCLKKKCVFLWSRCRPTGGRSGLQLQRLVFPFKELFFFFNVWATPWISPLSLHGPLPI